MKIAFFAYSRQGCKTVRSLLSLFRADDVCAYTMARFEEDGFKDIGRPHKSFYGGLFSSSDALIFIGACGIAVREIAPHVRDKRDDPAVICIDERGRFVIPLLCGHIGGANDLAAKIAHHIKAVPVITTATDINKRFSVDAWAAKNTLIIDSMQLAKAVSAAILEQDLPLACDFDIAGDLPLGLYRSSEEKLGICISYRIKSPFKQTLRLIPQILHLGIGCRKGTSSSAIYEAVATVFAQNELDQRAVRSVASIDLKANEEGLLSYCKKRGFEPCFYTPEELLKVEGALSSSPFVQQITGVDNVCERAALIAADNLIVHKTALHGVTVAVAAEKLEVHFG